VALAAPSVRTVVQAASSTQNWSTAIYGSTTEYRAIRNWVLASGEWFTEGDVTSAAGVCLLGATTVNQLFGSEDPLGQTIRIKKIPFRVIGTLRPKGQSAQGDDQDDAIIAPVTTVQKKIMGMTSIGMILASATSPGETKAASEQITLLLRQRHRILVGQEDDFTVRNLADLSAAAQATSGVFTTLLGSIASISLLVGGIGIMNIMLVSVSERTREIGIRRSLGARSRDILAQFLVEAIVLSLFGGMIGIALGVVASRIVTVLAEWETTIAPESVALAFAFSALVGLVFGIYPARRAARLDPIEALRHE
jgi:putative ABC transport system permease protein